MLLGMNESHTIKVLLSGGTSINILRGTDFVLMGEHSKVISFKLLLYNVYCHLLPIAAFLFVCLFVYLLFLGGGGGGVRKKGKMGKYNILSREMDWEIITDIVQTTLKAILRDVMGEEKFYFSLFFIIHLCNDPCCHRIISPQYIRAGYFA